MPQETNVQDVVSFVEMEGSEDSVMRGGMKMGMWENRTRVSRSRSEQKKGT